MNILWLAPEPPVPPLTGGRERARKMLLYLAQRHKVYLFTFAEQADAPLLSQLKPRLAGMAVAAYGEKKRFRGVERRITAGWAPDLIHVQGVEMLSLRPPGLPFVLDLHDIPSRLETQQSELVQGSQSPVAALQRWRRARAIRSLELRASLKASNIIVCTDEDREALTGSPRGRDLPITVLPNGVDLDHWSVAHAPPVPDTILFPAALNWAPNVDAATILARRLLPMVRRHIPSARVVIAGRRPSQPVRDLASESGVKLVEDPANMLPLFAKATLVAVPLRVATGSRLKILQALAIGRAVISTPLGAQGIRLVPGKDLQLAPLYVPFAEALVELLNSEEKREALQSSGRLAVAKHAWDQQLPQLDQIYRA